MIPKLAGALALFAAASQAQVRPYVAAHHQEIL